MINTPLLVSFLANERRKRKKNPFPTLLEMAEKHFQNIRRCAILTPDFKISTNEPVICYGGSYRSVLTCNKPFCTLRTDIKTDVGKEITYITKGICNDYCPANQSD